MNVSCDHRQPMGSGRKIIYIFFLNGGCGDMVNYCPLEGEWGFETIKLHVSTFVSPGLLNKKLAQIAILTQHGVRSLHENAVGGHREPFRQECCIQLALFNVKLRRQEIVQHVQRRELRNKKKMDRFQVPPPQKFDFSKPEEWPKWSKRFERFRVASGLELQPEENQVNTLIYTMGDEAEDISHHCVSHQNSSVSIILSLRDWMSTLLYEEM